MIMLVYVFRLLEAPKGLLQNSLDTSSAAPLERRGRSRSVLS